MGPETAQLHTERGPPSILFSARKDQFVIEGKDPRASLLKAIRVSPRGVSVKVSGLETGPTWHQMVATPSGRVSSMLFPTF